MSYNTIPTSANERRPREKRTEETAEETTLEDGRRPLNTEPRLDRPFLSVVIPAYNEAESVESTVRTVTGAANAVCDSYEVIVVDDGSEDATPEALHALAEAVPAVRFVRHEQNIGKGHAIRNGCRTALGRYVLFMDADGDLTPNRIAAFVERVQETEADVVIGSKRHPESDVSYPLKRRVLSRGYSLLIRLLFGLQVTDTQVGMKLLRGDAVDDVMPLVLVERYAFDVELLALAHRHGYEIAEAPVSLDFDGDSEIDWREICRITWDTLTVFCRLKLLGSYDKLHRAVSYERQSDLTFDREVNGNE